MARRADSTPTRPSGLPSFHLRAGFIFQKFSVPTQIAPHHHGFQPDGCRRFIGGTVEMEQTSLCIFVAAHREAAKREARALHPCRLFDEERGGALKRNRLEICL
jgi:hypothetical protein